MLVVLAQDIRRLILPTAGADHNIHHEIRQNHDGKLKPLGFMDRQDFHRVAVGNLHVEVLAFELLKIREKRSDVGVFFLDLLDQLEKVHQKPLSLAAMLENLEPAVGGNAKLVKRVEPDVAEEFLNERLPNFRITRAELLIQVQVLFTRDPLPEAKDEPVHFLRRQAGRPREDIAKNKGREG